MKYKLYFTPEAEKQLTQWQKSGQKKQLVKLLALFKELQEHPTTGTGQVEQLRGNLNGFWSRRIDKSSRLVYKILDEAVIVVVVSLKGHYGDK